MQLDDLKSGMIIQTVTAARFLVLGNLAMSLDSNVPSHPLSYFTFDPADKHTAITHVYAEPHFSLGSLAPAANWWFTKDNLLEHSKLTLIWEYKAPPVYEYPLYRKLGSELTYVIVKFTNLHTGTVIDSTSDKYEIGYESTKWASHICHIWEPVEVIEIEEDEFDSLETTLAQLEEFLGIKITIIE